MLKVTFSRGDVTTEKSFFVNDLVDVRAIQDHLIDETQRIFAEGDEEKEEMLQEIFKLTDCETLSELKDWVEEVSKIKQELDDSDYYSMDEIWDKLYRLEETIDTIYWAANDVRS